MAETTSEIASKAASELDPESVSERTSELDPESILDITSAEQNFVTGRDVAALHDPRPTCVIGARTDAGEVCFATVIWVTPLSHDPAMVAFALRAKSRTMEIIRATGHFSISVPHADAEGIDLIEFCGNNTGHSIDKGQVVAHELVSINDDGNDGGDAGAGDNNSAMVPIVKHAYSWEVGVIESIQEAGDHLLAVGTITRAATCAPRDERGQLTPYDSLLCIQHGTYAKADVVSPTDSTDAADSADSADGAARSTLPQDRHA